MFGDTHLLATMNPVFINGNGWLDNNMYQLTFNDQVSDIFHNQLLIGAFGQMDYISKITMAFLDHDYNIIRNEDHDPMEFLGYEHPLGHFFDLITMTLPYSYIRFLFHPKGNERFDPNKVYVHSGNKTGPKPEDENQRNGSLPIEVDEEELTALNNDTVAIDNMINETLSTIEGSDELAHLDQCLAAAAAAARPTIGRGRRQQSSVNCSLVNSQMGFEYEDNRIAMIQGVWNTSAGANCTLAGPGSGKGKYLPQTPPIAVFDNEESTKYLSFGKCGGDSSSNLTSCGLKTGFYFSFVSYPKPMKSFKIRTAADIAFRDPLRVTIEGSNATSSSLCQGASWTLLYAGESGLAYKFRRGKWGTTRSLVNNSKVYRNYRFLVTEKRFLSIGVQYADIQFNFGDDQEQPNVNKGNGRGRQIMNALAQGVATAFNSPR